MSTCLGRNVQPLRNIESWMLAENQWIMMFNCRKLLACKTYGNHSMKTDQNFQMWTSLPYGWVQAETAYNTFILPKGLVSFILPKAETRDHPGWEPLRKHTILCTLKLQSFIGQAFDQILTISLLLRHDSCNIRSMLLDSYWKCLLTIIISHTDYINRIIAGQVLVLNQWNKVCKF